MANLANYENNLNELCALIAPDIENYTNQDKKDVCAYLDLKTKVTPEGADIKGY
jgi:hypothetical protein